MRTMNLTRTTVLLLALVGCDTAEQADQASMYEEAMVQIQARQSLEDVSAPAEAHLPPPAQDPLAFAADLEAFIASQADCAVVEQDGDELRVDFGDAEDGCDYLERNWSGSLSAVLTETETGIEMAMTLSALSDGIITMTGDALAILSDSEHAFISDLHISHDPDALPPHPDGACGEECEGGGKGGEGGEGGAPPEGEGMGGEGEGMGGEEQGMRPPPPPAEVDVVASRTETPLDGDFANGVVVNGERSMSAEEGDASMTEVGLEIRAGERIPQAGTVTMDGPRGLGTISFSRVDDDTIEVTMDGPEGKQSFLVDPVSGQPQE